MGAGLKVLVGPGIVYGEEVGPRAYLLNSLDHRVY